VLGKVWSPSIWHECRLTISVQPIGGGGNSTGVLLQNHIAQIATVFALRVPHEDA
jgi:hypothetical protein